MSFAVFVVLLTALAAADVPLPPIRSERGRRLSAAAFHDPQVRDLRLSAIHTSRIEEGGLVHVRHEVEGADSEAYPRRSQAAFPANPREEIRQLIALVAVARPELGPNGETTNRWGPSVYSPILEDGDSLHGPGVQDYGTEINMDSQLYDSVVASLVAVGDLREDPGDIGVGNPNTRDSRDVHALEFYRAGYGTVLLFRETFSDGDAANLKLWMREWFLTRIDAQMKYQWINGAGLPWTAEMMGRERVIDTGARIVMAADNSASAESHLEAMQLLALNRSMDADAAAETGYWEFSKLIAEVVRNETRGSLNSGERLILSGWSQGGARAALISMYFEKRYGEIYDTFTFGATGGSCFSRRLSHGNGNMLEDVDPYVQHEQIRDFTHVLDVYGNMDYDPGYQCRWGTSAVAESSAAKYCGQVFGYSGVHLVTAWSLGFMLGSNLGSAQQLLADAFARCLYFTHSRNSLLQLYESDEYLLEDGTTDGGCTLTSQITEEDPQALCPAGNGLLERDGCNDQLSCGACVVSDSSDSLVGFQCFWCEETQSCHSRGTTMFFEGCPSSWLGPPSPSANSDGSSLELGRNYSFAANDTALIFHPFGDELAELMGVARDEIVLSYRFTIRPVYAGSADAQPSFEDAIVAAFATEEVNVHVLGESGRATVEISTTSQEAASRIASLSQSVPASAEGLGWGVEGVPQVQMEILGGVIPPRQCTAEMADQVFDANNVNNGVISDASKSTPLLPLAALATAWLM